MHINDKKFEYTAVLWDTYSLPGQNNADGTPVLFYYKRAEGIKLDMYVDSGQTRVHIFSDVPLGRNAQIRDVKNRYGQEPLPGGAYRITLVNPNLNSLGQQEGYHMIAALAYAGDFEYEFEEDKPAGAV